MKRRPVTDLFEGLGLPATAPAPPKPRGRPGPTSPSGRARKGFKVEGQIAALIRDLGIRCEKTPLSGALASRLGPGYAGDLKMWVLGPASPPLTAEVKSRSHGAGFITLENWLASCDLLVLKRNDAAPMVALPWHIFARIIIAARRG